MPSPFYAVPFLFPSPFMQLYDVPLTRVLPLLFVHVRLFVYM